MAPNMMQLSILPSSYAVLRRPISKKSIMPLSSGLSLISPITARPGRSIPHNLDRGNANRVVIHNARFLRFLTDTLHAATTTEADSVRHNILMLSSTSRTLSGWCFDNMRRLGGSLLGAFSDGRLAGLLPLGRARKIVRMWVSPAPFLH